MSRLNDTKRLILISAVTVLLCGGAAGGIYWAKGKVEEEREQIEQKRAQITAAEAKIAKIADLERQVIILRENLKEYVKILPEKQELTTFVRASHQFAGQSGVAIERFVPGQVVNRRGAEFEERTYTFEFRATLWQFLKFINFFENYERFVKVKNFTLTAGGGNNARAEPEFNDADVPHKISMLVETYVYTSNSKSEDVKIPNYAAKRQALAEDIVRDQQQIRLEKYEFREAKGRRDIFIDPREFSYGGRDSAAGLPTQQQKKVLDEFTEGVSKLFEIANRTKDDSITIFEKYSLERTLRSGLQDLESKAQDVEKQKLISYQPYRLQWTRKVMQPMEELRRGLEKQSTQEDDRYLSRKDLDELLAGMADDLEAGEMESARDRYVAVQDKLVADAADPRHALAERARELFLRANIALEFKGQRLDIAGVIVNEQGRSGLILNGEVFQEGDYVSDELLVKAVGRDYVEFVYKGFTLLKSR